MKCPECHADNPDLAKYCHECGAYTRPDENPKKWFSIAALSLSLFFTSFSYRIFPIPLLGMSYWGEILTSHWICKLIVFASFWCLFILLFYYLHFIKNKRITREAMSLVQSGNSLSLRNVKTTLARKGYKRYYYHPVYRILLKNKNRALENREALKNFCENEIYRLDMDYTLIKFFIWAIPILGFIGTVAGIAFSVSEFSSFIQNLKGMEQLSSEMKNALSGVTSGLSAAFNTTFLALIMILPLMFVSNILQKKEEEVLLRLEDWVSENLFARRGKPKKEKKRRFIL